MQQKTCLVLMDRFVSREFDFILWKFLQEKNIQLETLPRSLSKSLTTFNAGGLTRYTNRMIELILCRYLSHNVFYIYMYIHLSCIKCVLMCNGLYSVRLVNVGLPVDEKSIVWLHNIIIGEGDVHAGMLKTVRMLELSKLVARSPRQRVIQSAIIEPCATDSQPPPLGSPVARAVQVSSRSKSRRRQASSESTSHVQQMERLYREMGTQTSPSDIEQRGPDVAQVDKVAECQELAQSEDEALIDDVVQTEDTTESKPDIVELLKLKMEMCVNTIRAQDFMAEYETVDLTD